MSEDQDHRRHEWGEVSPDDAAIAELVVCSEAELYQLPGFEAFEREYRAKHERFELWATPDQFTAKIRRLWRVEVEERNDRLRAANKRAQHIRKLAPRHGPLVLDGKLDLTTPAIIELGRWASAKQSIAILSGPPGTGKTAAAAWWAVQYARATGHLPAWTTAAEFSRSSKFGDEREQLLASSALVLDDLGAEHLAPTTLADVDELVNAFYSNARPLVITTNVDTRRLEERYGARVVDRLAECGRWIAVTGTSRRRGPRKEHP